MDIEKQESTMVDQYISQFSEEVQYILNEIRRIIHETAPDATEKISYQMPTFFLKENLVHFAVHKKHIGFYPTPSGIEAFKDDISKYKWAKGSVQFPLDQPMPYDLIRKITLYRVEEVMNRNKKVSHQN